MAKTVWENVFDFVWLLVLCKVVITFNVDTLFPVIYNNTNGSYFGYTVALHRNSKGPLALVGAPRSNVSALQDIHQPGALFKCEIPTNASEASCIEVDLYGTRKRTGTSRDRDHSYVDEYANMWLGMSLDIQQGATQNDIVICSHLWRNSYHKNYFLANGACYVISSDLELNIVKKLLPLIDLRRQSIVRDNRQQYDYAYGQAGISAVYSEDGSYLLLGAPGILEWAGSGIIYQVNETSSSSGYNSPTIPNPPRNVSSDSYLGYSATSGRFFNTKEDFFAVGAPRSDDHGRVYIFKAEGQEDKELSVHQEKEGTQLTEYFGASILGVDLNGDSYTDLLIGAPMYSTESGGDEGRVFVYISDGRELQDYGTLNGSKPNARFGASIANVGDLNQDGFNDVAIGAPYEDGKGAVYIYHGSQQGMNLQHVQKIEALEVNPQLSGFGIHISRGLDIDNNSYPDILVGAYLSSNAILFRTHPVIHLTPKIVLSLKQINTTITNCAFPEKVFFVNVTTCLQYTGKHVPVSLDFENEIFIEHSTPSDLILPRAFFLQNQMSRITQQETLKRGEEKCRNYTLQIHVNYDSSYFSRRNVNASQGQGTVLFIWDDFDSMIKITAIDILFRYRLVQPVNADESFDASFPVIDPSSPEIKNAIAEYYIGAQCSSDLFVTAQMLGSAASGHLTLGEMSIVSVAISVKNKGEPAYLSQLYIHLPSELSIINQDICKDINSTSLVCDLGDPLIEGGEAKILIKLDITEIPNNRKLLYIFLEAVTNSVEIFPEDNNFNVSLHLQAIADISIRGTSSEEQIIYDEDKGGYNASIPISHKYTIRNHGPSSLEMIDILLNVPVAFFTSTGWVPFITITGLETYSEKQLTIPAKCSDAKTFLLEEKYQRQNIIEENPVVKSARVDIGKEDRTLSETRKNFTINCDYEDIKCIPIQCFAGPFLDSTNVTQITVAFQVNFTVLAAYLGPRYQLEFTTVGRVTMNDVNVQERQQYPDVADVKIVILYNGHVVSKEVPLWIIFVSIGVGILLLILILLLLIKFGFFKRKDKERMEEILDTEKEENNTYDNEVIDDESLN